MVACLDSEQQQWDMVLNASFQTLVKGLEPEQQQKLREMQRAWLVSRAATCGFYQDYFDGTMANPMIANCMNRETARARFFSKVLPTIWPNGNSQAPRQDAANAGTGSAVTDLIFSIAKRDVTFFSATALISFL